MPEVVQDASWNRINQIGNLGNGVSRAVDLYNMFKPGGTEDQRRQMMQIAKQNAENEKLLAGANARYIGNNADYISGPQSTNTLATAHNTDALTQGQQLQNQFTGFNNSKSMQVTAADNNLPAPPPLPPEHPKLGSIGSFEAGINGFSSSPSQSNKPSTGGNPDFDSAAAPISDTGTGMGSDNGDSTSGNNNSTGFTGGHKPVIPLSNAEPANSPTPSAGVAPLPGTNQAYNVPGPTGTPPVNVQQPSRVKAFIPNQPSPATITFKGRTMPNPANPSFISNPNYIAPELNKFGKPNYRNANQTNQFISNPNYIPPVTPQQTPATTPPPLAPVAPPLLPSPAQSQDKIQGGVNFGLGLNNQSPTPTMPASTINPSIPSLNQATTFTPFGKGFFDSLSPEDQKYTLDKMNENLQKTGYWHPGNPMYTMADAAQTYNQRFSSQQFGPTNQIGTPEAYANISPFVSPKDVTSSKGGISSLGAAQAGFDARQKMFGSGMMSPPPGKEYAMGPDGKWILADMPPGLIKGMDGLPKEASDKVTTIRSDFVKSPSYPEFLTATGALNNIDNEVAQIQKSGRNSQETAVILSSIAKLDNPGGVLRLSIVDLMKQDPSLAGKITIEAGKLIGKGELNMDQIKEIQNAAHTYYSSDRTNFANAYKDALISAQESTGGQVPMNRLARMVSGVVGAQSIIPDQTNLNQNQSQGNQNYPTATGKDGTKIFNKDGQWFNSKTGQPFKG